MNNQPPAPSAHPRFLKFPGTAPEAAFRVTYHAHGDPGVRVVENALFTDQSTAELHQVFMTGGVFDAAGEYEDASATRRIYSQHRKNALSHWEVRECTPQVWVDEPVVYLGINIRHYGHFLTESLARAWALREYPPDRFKFILHGGQVFDEIREPYRTLLSALGLHEGNLINANAHGCIGVRRLIVPMPSLSLGDEVYAVHGRPFAQIRAALSLDVVQTDQPLWLSRSGLGPGQRLAPGELALERELAAHGVRVMRPEEHTLQENITAILRHGTIMGFHGSALHSILFAQSPKRLFAFGSLKLFQHNLNLQNYLLCDLVAGAQSCYVNSNGHLKHPRQIYSAGVELPDYGYIGKVLAEAGVIPEHAVRNIRGSELRRDFQRIWLMKYPRPTWLQRVGARLVRWFFSRRLKVT